MSVKEREREHIREKRENKGDNREKWGAGGGVGGAGGLRRRGGGGGEWC